MLHVRSAQIRPAQPGQSIHTSPAAEDLEFSVMDYDKTSAADLLGKIVLKRGAFQRPGGFHGELQLEDMPQPPRCVRWTTGARPAAGRHAAHDGWRPGGRAGASGQAGGRVASVSRRGG